MKPLNDFYRKHNHPDGYRYECKECAKKDDKLRYLNKKNDDMELF